VSDPGDDYLDAGSSNDPDEEKSAPTPPSSTDYVKYEQRTQPNGMRRTTYTIVYGNVINTIWDWHVEEVPLWSGCIYVTHKRNLECEYIETRWEYYSPIIIDVNNLGKADTLSGTWKKQDAKGVPDYFNTRLFDLDLDGLKRWSWVGPKAGLLVYSATGVPKEITGRDLFGNITWGQPWKDGYEPLASLDQDDSGDLKDKELELLYIWLDANTNAKPDAGEVKPVREYVKSISVVPSRDEEGNAWNHQGATLLDDSKVGSWDWWTSAYNPPSVMIDEQGRSLPVPYTYSDQNPEPALIYRWKTTKAGNFKQIDGSGGFLRFWKKGDRVFVVGLPDSAKGYFSTPIAEVTFDSESNQASWTFDGQLETRISFNRDGGFEGVSQVIGTDQSYKWEAALLTAKESDSIIAKTLALADTEQLEMARHVAISFLEPGSGKLEISKESLKSLF
jgi:hypothetical protein